MTQTLTKCHGANSILKEGSHQTIDYRCTGHETWSNSVVYDELPFIYQLKYLQAEIFTLQANFQILNKKKNNNNHCSNPSFAAYIKYSSGMLYLALISTAN